jgi:hypothetical protein
MRSNMTKFKAATVADTDQPRKGGDAPLSKIFSAVPRQAMRLQISTRQRPTAGNSDKENALGAFHRSRSVGA